MPDTSLKMRNKRYISAPLLAVVLLVTAPLVLATQWKINESRAIGQSQHSVSGKKGAEAKSSVEVHNSSGYVGSHSNPVNQKRSQPKTHGLSGEAYYTLGMNLLHTGNWREAELYLNKAKKTAPNTPRLGKALSLVKKERDLDSRLRRAEMRRHSGDWKDAVKQYREILAIAPNLARAHKGLGLALEETAEVDQAIEALKMAVKLDPAMIDARTSLGYLYQRKQDNRQAIQVFEQAAMLSPGDESILRELAELFRRNGRAKDAIRIYEKIVFMKPEDIGSLQALADLHWQKGERDRASVIYRTVIALKGNTIDSLTDLTAAYRTQKNETDRVLAILDLRTQVGAGSLAAFLDLAREYNNRGAYPSALLVVSQATEQWPEEPSVYELKGDIFWNDGQRANALDAYRQRLILSREVEDQVKFISGYSGEDPFSEPSDQPDRSRLLAIVNLAESLHTDDAYFYGQLGKALSESGEQLIAIEELEKAVRLAPREARYRQQLAAIFEKSGDLSKAKDQLVLAEQIDQDNVVTKQRLATIFTAIGDLESSVSKRRELAKLTPTDATNHYQLGENLDALKRADEAVSEYKQAAFLAPYTDIYYSAMEKVAVSQGDVVNAAFFRNQRLADLTNFRVTAHVGGSLAGGGHGWIHDFLGTGTMGSLGRILGGEAASSGPHVLRELEEVSTQISLKNTSAKSAFQSIHWNTWVDDPSMNDGPMTVLLPNSTYIFTLSLSRYDFKQIIERPLGGIRSSEAADEVQKLLGKVSADTITLKVLPILEGRGLEFPDTYNHLFQDFPININILSSREPLPKDRLDDFRSIQKRVSASTFTIPVNTTESGCSQIAIAVWNMGLTRPIDVVIHKVAIATDKGEIPKCSVKEEPKKEIRPSFLDYALVVEAQPDDMALQIIQMTDTKSVAVFVGHKGVTPSTVTWKFDADLGQFLNNGQFLALLKDARKTGDYSRAGTQMGDILFSGSTTRDREAAKSTQERILQTLEASSSPTLHVTYLNRNGKTLFLPFGMIRIGSSSLSDKVKVVQPLPQQTLNEEKTCISNWTIMLPEVLEKVYDPTNAFYQAHRKVSPDLDHVVRLSNYTAFSSHIKTESSYPTAEGLLLLAHQDQGNLWFEDSKMFIPTGLIARTFSPGSIAILASCGAADPSEHNKGMPLLTKLNTLGVDAMVVSPFSVPVELGVLFATLFNEEVVSALTALKKDAKREGPRVLDLFQRAAASAQSVSKVPVKGDARQEFIYAGNPNLRICRE